MKRLGMIGLLAAAMVLSSPGVMDVQAAGVISGGITGAVVGGAGAQTDGGRRFCLTILL